MGLGSFLSQLLGGGAGLSPAQVKERLQGDSQVQLIDVRSPQDYKEGYIKGSRLIPLPELPTRLREIKADRPVLLFCRSGMRSSNALSLLKNNGYTQVEQISGGIMAWSMGGHPVETK
jgi:adenylyltransferase/sulfurtransferase